MVAAERPHGVFSQDGVLRLTIPIAEHAKPRRIEVSRSDEKVPITAWWSSMTTTATDPGEVMH
jgi:HSP20 family protein